MDDNGITFEACAEDRIFCVGKKSGSATPPHFPRKNRKEQQSLELQHVKPREHRNVAGELNETFGVFESYPRRFLVTAPLDKKLERRFATPSTIERPIQLDGIVPNTVFVDKSVAHDAFNREFEMIFFGY